MTRLRAAIVRLVQLRHHPQRKIRCAWWLVTLGLFVLGFSGEPLRSILFAVLLLINGFLTLAATVWGVTHIRVLKSAWSVAARWSLWIAVFATLTISSFVGNLITEQARITLPTNLMLVTALLGFFPVFFGLAFANSCFGAALGGWLTRHVTDVETRKRVACVGVGAHWLATLLVTFATTLLWDIAPQNLTASVLFALPLWTLSLLSRLYHYDGQSTLLTFVHFLGERLVRKRIDRRGRVRTLDMRGAALGTLAALLALFALRVGLFGGLQATVLAQLMQVTNASALWLSRTASLSVPRGRDQFSFRVTQSKRPSARERIVLLEMDATTQRAALTNRSETAVQAEIIQKLSMFGAKCIVLPMPVTLGAAAFHDAPFSRDAFDFTDEDAAHSRRDQGKLWKAVEDAGNVILAMPSNRASSPEETTDRKARTLEIIPDPTRVAGSSELSAFRVAQLPSLQLDSLEEYAPLPLVVLAKAQGQPYAVRALPGASDAVEIAGVRVPLIAPNRILLFLNDAEPGHDFAHVSYSDVLHGEPLYAGTVAGKGENDDRRNLWLPPKTYFKDKIVFLDTLMPRIQETPVGTMPQNEALAYATAMLLSESFLARAPWFSSLIVTLLLGLLVGHFCAGKTPIQAFWRVVVVLLALLLISTGLMSQNLWWDPVAPALATVGAFLLATQFTYGLERQERERNRSLLQRLVAPEFVEGLLEDPEGKLGMHGKRQTVCILFADVRGFTPFAEQNTPETVVEVINAYLMPMTEALLKQGGILDKYTGDGLMAIFRVTSEPQENVKKAVQAALDMQAAVAEVSQRLIAQGKTSLPVGIGVHYGEAVVGLIGNPPHQVNYTALGHAVIVSQRLQSLALGGEVIISEAVHATLKGAFPVEASDPVSVKGLSVPVRPYRVTAPPALPAAPKLPPLPSESLQQQTRP